ncbi:unnamed protein product [Rodentolepis nana]|uniref:Ig-like domain-containing protein n=1 Tax=Rodentolepis nana TaxID=102285 RepID=A0A0R3T632_RODNA|nr:unnamed protein product [Rodentolepis nana]
MTVKRLLSKHADESKEIIGFQCKGFATRHNVQTIMLRWSVNKRSLNETSPKYDKISKNIGMFTGDLVIRTTNLPQNSTIRCSAYSTIITRESNRIQISRNKKLRVDFKELTSVSTNREFDHVTSVVLSDFLTILAVSIVAILATLAIIILKRKGINFPKADALTDSERESPEGCSMDNLSSGRNDKYIERKDKKLIKIAA